MTAITNITHLPLDVLITIFSLLDYKDLKNVILTCRSFRDVIKTSPIIWLKNNRHDLVTNELCSHFLCKCCVRLTPYERCRVSRNWRKGAYSGKVLFKHNTNYLPWIQLLSHHLLVSVGSQLFCYSRNSHGIPNTNNSLWIEEGPNINISSSRQNNDITRFVQKNNHILLGNSNGSISAFSWLNSKYSQSVSSKNFQSTLPKLLFHAKNCHENGKIEVSCVDFLEYCNDLDIICSGSRYDRHIKIWKCMSENAMKMSTNINKEFDSSDNLKVVHNINVGYQGRLGLLCLQLNEKGNLLCCGLYGNKHPLLVDIETGQKILDPQSEHNICQATTDLQWLNRDTVVLTSHSGMITCTDIRSGKENFSVSDPFGAAIFCVKTDGTNSVLTGASQHSRCVLYDLRNSRGHVQMYFTNRGQSSRVYGLDFDSTVLVTALDRRVACLNFNVNCTTTPIKDYGRSFVHMI